MKMIEKTTTEPERATGGNSRDKRDILSLQEHIQLILPMVFAAALIVAALLIAIQL